MEITRSTSEDGVLTLTMDDGKKNALDTDAFAAITEAFDAAGDARAIVLAGREDIFSAGLNVKYMATAGRDGVADLLVAFGRTLMRVWLEPRPTVAACTGHALAAGTMFAMACDHAVAAAGPHWWGLTETRINFEMPHFGIELARHNVRADRLEDLLLPGAQIPAEEAVEVGYADELVALDQVLPRAQAKAAELAALPPAAYAGTKRRLRGMSAEAVLTGLQDDISALLASFPDASGGGDG
ncbi:MAG: enoyl-CoA hydratase/isomerase family protein [Actinobacteria bacterium]|nr:enoyl-CoA hydratase/isomerase family protein [Actinomycetota bacterium]